MFFGNAEVACSFQFFVILIIAVHFTGTLLCLTGDCLSITILESQAGRMTIYTFSTFQLNNNVLCPSPPKFSGRLPYTNTPPPPTSEPTFRSQNNTQTHFQLLFINTTHNGKRFVDAIFETHFYPNLLPPFFVNLTRITDIQYPVGFFFISFAFRLNKLIPTMFRGIRYFASKRRKYTYT